MGGERGTFLRLVGVVTAVAVGLGCGFEPVDRTPRDGGKMAFDEAGLVADQLNGKLGRRDRARDAEYIAATEVPTEPQRGGQVRATPLAWSGRVFSDEKAVIDVRFFATVAADDAFEHGNTAGSATRCFRYTLQMYRDTLHQEIPCPALPSPPAPSASAPLMLPFDAEDRLAAALRTATPETLERAVRAAFPQQGIHVETVTDDGTLVAAVGVIAERQCVVMIRTPTGEIKPVGFDRVQLTPGEAGCSTSLYTNPPR